MIHMQGEVLLAEALSYLTGQKADGSPHPRDVNKSESIMNTILNYNIGNPQLLYSLGSVHLNKGNYGLAITLLSQATNMVPSMGPAWNNLGLAWMQAANFERSDYALVKAAKSFKDPKEKADVYCNLAANAVTRNTPEKILEWTEKALELIPDHPKAIWHKAIALLELRRWEEAWDLHEMRLYGGAKDVMERNYHLEKKTPVWDGLAKGRLVIHGEQGMGDEIMFSSCIPDVIRSSGCEIIFEPSPRLENLFKRSFEGIAIYGTNDADGGAWTDKLGRPDFKIALGSLPRFYRRSAASFPGTPFLKPDREKRAWWGDKIKGYGSKLAIGISWQGGVQHTRFDARSFHPEKLRPLFETIDATWISLQYDDTARECVEEVRKLGVKICHWPKAVEQKDPDTGKASNLDELVALISKLDLVISVCNTNIHVAGALGVPCFCLTPSDPSWRYGAGEATDMPWYRSVRQFRQDKGSKDWGPPIERAAIAAQDFALQRKIA